MLEYAEDLRGKRFFLVGKWGFDDWPSVLPEGGPEPHLRRRNARLVSRLEDADFLVVGNKPGKGKAEALRKAERLRAEGRGPQTLDPTSFLFLLRPKIAGKAFLFVGGMSRGLDLESPSAMVVAAGGQVITEATDAVDFAVVGSGRGRGKQAELARLKELQVARPSLRVLDEDEFLDLMACLRRPGESGYDARGLAVHLRTLTDPKKVERAIRMLKEGALQLYHLTTASSVGGIVRSQTEPEAYYACWMQDDGSFSCFDGNMRLCMGMRGDICKHLVVLLVGLASKGLLDARVAHGWAQVASRESPVEEPQASAELVLRLKSAQAGEIDWRPTETVPEDYYAL